MTLTFLREGKPSFTKTFTVPPTSRFNVTTGPGSMVPELQDERFGVRIDALLITTPIVVERAMYSNAGGVVWSAGTNATAHASARHVSVGGDLEFSPTGTAGAGAALRSEASAVSPPPPGAVPLL